MLARVVRVSQTMRRVGTGCQGATPRRDRAARQYGARGAVVGGACVLLLSCLGACGAGPMRLVSVNNDAELRADLALAGYAWSDRNSADFYFTDLSDRDLAPGADWTGVSGQIVHVRMFIRPRAGRTPIEQTAQTATVRHLVIARGEIGLYAGGGYFSPSGDAGDQAFGGTIRRASMRLVGATPGFQDWLGYAEFHASFRAPLDEISAREIAAVFEAAAGSLPREDITRTAK